MTDSIPAADPPTQALPAHAPEAPAWIVLAKPGPETSTVPIKRRRVFAQVAAAAGVVIIAVALLGIFAARRLAEAEAVNDAAQTADLIAEALVQPALQDGLLTGDPAALAAIDEVVRNHVLDEAIVRVKIWDTTGRIIYSDEKRLIGMVFELEEEEREVFTDPQIRADVSDLEAPENQFEQQNDKLLEAYRPVWTPSGAPLLFETYFRYDEVTQRSGELWRGFAGVTLTSILLVVALLIPVLWRLLDRLRLAQTQREELLQKALDASAAERRRIAGTLHDGVVQDLAATSFSLSGVAERSAALGDPALTGDLHLMAGIVRSSMGGLRTLLVDIYPPSLTTAGLPAALNDLTTSLRSRNISVQLEIPADPEVTLDLNEATERLIFRVAQECLHNSAKHSAAQTVRIELSQTRAAVQLEIEDDGIGFDPDQQLEHPAEGHFGLRVLSDVVAEAGATLELRTAPGQGTLWRLRVNRA